MQERARQLWIALRARTGAWWYPPFVGLLAALDLFIMIVPTDALVVLGAWKRKNRAPWLALSATLGSVGGAALLWALIAAVGHARLAEWAPWIFDGDRSPALAAFLDRWGPWAAAVNAFGPFPQVTPLLPTFLLGANPGPVLFYYGVGRLVKFAIYCGVTIYAPEVLQRFRGLQEELEEVRPPSDGKP